MEEILASIRRIIEDSEPTAAPGNDAPEAKANADGATREAEEFKAELAFPKEPQRAELTPVEPERPRSMAEIQAALRKEQPAAAAAQVHPLRPSADAAPQRPAARPAQTETPRAELVARPPQQPQPAPAAKTQEDRPMAEPAPALRPAIDAAPAPRAAQPEAPRQVAAQAPASSARAEAGRGALVSDRSGKQVNASFGELAEAYQLVRKRSLADAAEDIMRPMLQEWLDNNLPRMVERLVREEIERVARGNDD
jgi:cell pole-organizing protein PopZ